MTLALEIRHLRKTYEGGVEAVKDINLEVREHDFFALLGENGAGKSTVLGIVCSLVNPSSGSVAIFGHDLGSSLSKAKREIGIVPQEFNFNIFERVGEIVSNQGGYYGLPRRLVLQRTEKYLKQLNLWEKRKEQAKTLSGGMKRRLMIARALVHEPRLLILDEPTAGVDIEIRHSMWDFLRDINRNHGKTIILTTHYLEEAEQLCRTVAIINQGKIIANSSMRELLRKLEEQTYIIEVAEDLEQDIKGDFYEGRRIDTSTLEIHLQKHADLNALFKDLDHKGLKIQSVDLKDNRLEKTFMELTR